jgi:hypothetical protein
LTIDRQDNAGHPTAVVIGRCRPENGMTIRSGEEKPMAKNRKKDVAVPYEFIQEVNKMTREEIVKRFIQEENDLTALKKIKREDGQIAEIAAQIKEYEEDIKDRIIALREKIKDIRSEDEEFVELLEDRKALEAGYRDEMKRRKAYRDYLYGVMQKAFQE